MKSQILFKNDWLSVRELEDTEKNIKYTYVHSERGIGDCVAILPFKIENDEPKFLVRADWIPCWGLDKDVARPKFMVSITGGIETGGPTQNVIKELKEEAGYEVTSQDLIELGASYISKVTSAFAYLYTVNLTDKQPVVAEGQDELEQLGETLWVGQKELIMQGADPLLQSMLAKILEIFNTEPEKQ